MQTYNNPSLETFPYGVTRWWLDDKQIAVIKTSGDMSHRAVDAWADMLIEMVQSWERGNVIATLHDLRSPKQGLTPYSRARTLDIVETLSAEHVAYTAILLPNTFITSLIGMFVRTLPFRRNNHHVRIFSDYDQAVAWLRQNIAAHN